ncbi:MAG: HAD family phosphatase [Actinobacteria bacterium]|nr:HAD family phosphatase [Actinomycetota bacterium]
MDGLLVDSEPLWFEVERVVMARMGSDWNDADQEYLIGGSLRRSVGYMLGKAARPVAPGLLAHWLVDGMAQVIRERGVAVKPGAARLLAEVTAAGIPAALVTSAERAIMEATLAVTGLRFTALVCAQDVTRPKPDPQPYQRAAAALGAGPRRCVALEDSPTGVSSAEAAGCVVIAVPSVPMPPRPGRVTVASLCDLSLGTLQEILASQRP